MKKILLVSLLPLGALAQNPVVPVLNTLIPDLKICRDDPFRTISLAEHFDTVEINDNAVRLTAEWRDLEGTPGTADFDFLLFRNITPVTAINFLGYVNRGDYENMVIHRLIKDFVVQGGGFTIVQGDGPPLSDEVPTQPAIVNEFGVSNTLATISMAKLGGDPDSATSQWFVSTGANSNNLDVQNGGFTVFGRVSQASFPDVMALNDGVGFTPVDLGGAFSGTPLVTGTINDNFTAERFFRFSSASEIPLPDGQAGTDKELTYSVVSLSGDAIASATIEEGNLLIELTDALRIGTATVVVQAEDSVGNQVVDTFEIERKTDYEEWRTDHFSGADLADDAVSGSMADPNDDGVSNLGLFVFGLPVEGDQSAGIKEPRLNLRTSDLQLELGISPGLCAVDFIVEESSDLEQWSATIGVTETSTRVGERDLLRFTLPRPPATESSVFFRIRFAPLTP